MLVSAARGALGSKREGKAPMKACALIRILLRWFLQVANGVMQLQSIFCLVSLDISTKLVF